MNTRSYLQTVARLWTAANINFVYCKVKIAQVKAQDFLHSGQECHITVTLARSHTHNLLCHGIFSCVFVCRHVENSMEHWEYYLFI